MTGSFKNIPAVLKHLKVSGWKVTDKTLRNHVGRRYLLAEKDGTFTADDVDRYALRFLKKHGRDGKKTDEVERLTVKKLREELRSLEMKNDKLDIELQAAKSGYITTEDHHRELAGRAIYYDNGMKHRHHIIGPKIIQIVGGDSGKLDELVEFMNQQHDEQLTEFANTDHYLVIVQGEKE